MQIIPSSSSFVSNFKFGQHIINGQSIKDLVIIYHFKLTLVNHIDQINDRAIRMLGFIIRSYSLYYIYDHGSRLYFELNCYIVYYLHYFQERQLANKKCILKKVFLKNISGKGSSKKSFSTYVIYILCAMCTAHSRPVALRQV